MEFVKEAMAFPVEIQGEQRVNVWITLWEEKSAKEEVLSCVLPEYMDAKQTRTKF